MRTISDELLAVIDCACVIDNANNDGSGVSYLDIAVLEVSCDIVLEKMYGRELTLEETHEFRQRLLALLALSTSE